MAERGSGIERRSSMQLPQQLPQQQQQQQPGQPNISAAAGAGANAASAAAAAGAADVSLQDTDMIDYKLGMQVSRLRWEVRALRAYCLFAVGWLLFCWLCRPAPACHMSTATSCSRITKSLYACAGR
jgi:hypothetical protein